ncbi:MAG: Ldh family oxidoreductase [Nitratireductor sp.]|nr:Ldh family oxidoreductase [Nitratireductor sp.]
MSDVPTKLELRGGRVEVQADKARAIITDIFVGLGCSSDASRIITDHLIDANLCGMESHGVMRVMQYAERMQNGTMRVDVEPEVRTTEKGVTIVDGGMGSGIPAMKFAYETAMELARESGLSAVSVLNTGHTGRHGAFADDAAEKGFLTICTGGGNHRVYGMVAPHGGAKGMLPTNPWCVGIPGGDRGPVVMDFATGKIAGGWIYAARSAGALLPEDCVIDRDGKPTRDPEDYFGGGAILPMGGHKGYALSLMAELIGEAMLGPSSPECNWFLLAIDTRKFRQPDALQAAAEEVLADLRNCPPAPGFDRVEIPGEREREQRERSNGILAIPEATWQQVLTLSEQLKQG